MADGRSRKAAATKKAAAVRERASRDTGGKRNAERIDKGPQVKMGIADPGFGRIVRVGAKGITSINRSRPKRVDPAPKQIRSTNPPTFKKPDPEPWYKFFYPPIKRFPGVDLPRGVVRSPSTNTSSSRTTKVLKDRTARWQAGQATGVAVGAPIARTNRSAVVYGRAAKAAATKKKK